MAITSGFQRLLIFSSSIIFVSLIVSSSAIEATGNHHTRWSYEAAMKLASSPCRGTIAECMAGGELEMDSEINRRILATSNYISYDALERNKVPCSQRGASYYNCEEGAEANPYNRGCSAITRCRS